MRISRILHNNNGSSSVEFAILAPVFLLLVFGMIAYAIYFGAAHYVQQVTADAARASISGLSAEERSTIVTAYMETVSNTYFLDPDNISYTVEDSSIDPDQFIVRVSYDASTLPIWNLYPPLPLPTRVISATSIIRKGGR